MTHNFFRRIAPAIALALGVGLAGCDTNITINGQEGVPLSELDMEGAAPTELVISGPDKVILTEGDTLDITTEGPSDTVEKLRFVLDGDTLGVTRENGDWGNSKSVVVRVTMPAPRDITIGGSGSVEAARVAPATDLTIGGSGDISITEIAAERLDVTIGGSGDVKGAGSAQQLDISIGGSGDVDFADLTADTVEISIGGSGNVTVASDGTVDTTIAGSGDVQVAGNAKCSVSALGSGSLTCSPRTAEAAASEDASVEAPETGDEAADEE